MLALLRTMGALGLVLGLLVGALWLVKRHGLRLPQGWLRGLGETGAAPRLELVERLALDPRRSVLMIRRDYREITLLVAPEGVVMLDAAPTSGLAAHRAAGHE